MSLGAAVVGALPGMRAEVESMMRDSCVVRDPSAASQTWDEATGTYVAGAAPTVYSGKCRVKRGVVDNLVVSGEADAAVADVTVSLPVTTSTAVRLGHEVTVTACEMDPALVDVVFQVVGPAHAQTHATARRLSCRVVSRG